MFDVEDLPERFRKKICVAPKRGCWLWRGSINNGGYGQVSWESKACPAHRIVYELLRGPIPRGLLLDHLCRVPDCVNPAHLEAVTASMNVRRGMKARGAPMSMHSIGFKADTELRDNLRRFSRQTGKRKGESIRELLRFALGNMPR